MTGEAWSADGDLVRIPADWPAPTPSPLPPALAGTRLLADSGAEVPLHVQARAAGVLAISATSAGARFLRLCVPVGAADSFAGGGAQFVDVALRGRVIDGWISDAASAQTYFHAPVLLSSAGWMLVVDTTARYTLDVAAEDPSLLSMTIPGGVLRAFVLLGTPRECIARLTEMTGRAPLPPPWAFGVWHNVRSGGDAIRDAARRLRDERIPGSALWIDDHYSPETNDGDGWPGNYPHVQYGSADEMRSLVSDVHALGFKALTYLNPMVYRDTPWHSSAVSQGLLVRDVDGSPVHVRFFHPLHAHRGVVDFEESVAALLDFGNPATVSAWQENVRTLLCDMGWDGWMEDFGEQLPGDAAAHNRYTLQYHGATSAERLRSKPGSVVLARSGWLGAQALANAYWGGDQLCEWSREYGIASVIPGGLSVGLLGVGTWGCDISGLFALPEKPLATGAGDRELWMRWCQLGAVTPVMRTHLGFKPAPTPPLDLWHDDEMTACFRRWAEFHVRLFPYLWACAQENASSGVPIMRGMFVEFPEDPVCWTLSDQYMLGPSLLVAPVLVRDARTRRVYLPEGEWYELGTPRRHAGPGWVEVSAPLDSVPIFQRGGTIVPMLAETPQTLADERFARGGYDLEVLVTPPGGVATLSLGDGTVMSLRGARLDVSGPSRTYLVRAHGAFLGLAWGSMLDFELSPAVALMGRERPNLESARRLEASQGVHHDEAVSPTPPRPGHPFTVHARSAASLDVVAACVHFTVDGSSPVGGATQVVAMSCVDAAPAAGAAPSAEPPGRPLAGEGLVPVGSSSGDGGAVGDVVWSATLPALPAGASLRYAIETTLHDGGTVWASDAGPGLEYPDPEVAFARPAAREFRQVVHEPSVPQWFREATVYHLLVDRFAASDGAALPDDRDVRFLQFAGGTLRGITQHLDHLSDLGVDCLLLSPITPGEMHVTYDVTDLRGVDPRFGTLDDVRALLREAHERGIRVLLDTETSYLGVRHPAFVAARADADSPYRSWFHWHQWPDRWYSWFSGRIFASLDHTNVEVRRGLLDAGRFWLDVGFDGFRLDSAAATPFEFWSEWGETVRSANPDAVTLGEAFGTTSSLRRYAGRLSGVFDFHLSHLLRRGLGVGDVPLRDIDALMRTRVAETAEEGGALARPIFVENHDMPRLSSVAADRASLLRALIALLTLGPTPILYYGTEVGVPQGPRQDLDPDARLPMRWGDAQDAALFDSVRRLVHLRRDVPALRRGEWRPLRVTDDALAYERRADADAIVVVLGQCGATVSFPVADVWPDGTGVTDLLGAASDATVRDGTICVSLSSSGAAVLSAR